MQLLEYDDVNDTARPSASFFPLYDLQKLNWSHFNLSGPTSLLCGTEGTFSNGSLCLQVCCHGNSCTLSGWIVAVNLCAMAAVCCHNVVTTVAGCVDAAGVVAMTMSDDAASLFSVSNSKSLFLV